MFEYILQVYFDLILIYVTILLKCEDYIVKGQKNMENTIYRYL
jgi:hypothetical protein